MSPEQFVASIFERIAIALRNEYQAGITALGASSDQERNQAHLESQMATAQRLILVNLLEDVFPAGTVYTLRHEPHISYGPYTDVSDAVHAKMVYQAQQPDHQFHLVVLTQDKDGYPLQIDEALADSEVEASLYQSLLESLPGGTTYWITKGNRNVYGPCGTPKELLSQYRAIATYNPNGGYRTVIRLPEPEYPDGGAYPDDPGEEEWS